ncbi:MFS transporter [Deinococcus koreensis]|uniref:MFS transporter n=1 Tax=Deinococcus koreensis TaxID=2054903 RepID=A0A2K3UW82_9DEIO|nr:MFS transporter [Deinococcus koreensis]PNY80786.1 MFS transporter [Deinococcus koreensis]
MINASSPPAPPANGWHTFLWLWGSQAVSVIGSALSGFAISIYLVQTRFPLPGQRGELATALSLTVLAFTLITVFGAPLAGALADRWNRRRMMLVSNGLNAALMGLGVLMVSATLPPIWLLVLFTACEGVLAALHSAAFDTSYSVLVPRENLPRANGMMQTLWSMSGLLSPALATLLIGLPALARTAGGPEWLAGWRDGVPLALLIDAASFLVAALVLLRLNIPTPPRRDTGGQRPGLGQDMTFGFRFVFARPALLNLLLTFTVFNLMTVGVSVLHPLLVKFTLAPDLQAHGWSAGTGLAALYTTFSLGGLLGGVLISAWGGLKRQRVLGVLIPMLAAGVAHALTGVAGTLILTCAALGLYGLMVPMISAHSLSIWQTQVPPELQGRVFSVRRLIAQCTTPLSVAAAGLVAAHAAPGAVLFWAGLCVVAVSGLQLLNPALRRVDEVPDAPPSASAA